MIFFFIYLHYHYLLALHHPLYISRVVGATIILPPYFLWIIKDNQNGWSNKSGKPCLCLLSYEEGDARVRYPLTQKALYWLSHFIRGISLQVYQNQKKITSPQTLHQVSHANGTKSGTHIHNRVLRFIPAASHWTHDLSHPTPDMIQESHTRDRRTYSKARQGCVTYHAFTAALHSMHNHLSLLYRQMYLFHLKLFPHLPFIPFLSTSHLTFDPTLQDRPR